MPPTDKPTKGRLRDQRQHLGSDVGRTQVLGQGAEPADHLREDAGRSVQSERGKEDKGLVKKAKDKLLGE
jgi:hypothetical protein